MNIGSKSRFIPCAPRQFHLPIPGLTGDQSGCMYFQRYSACTAASTGAVFWRCGVAFFVVANIWLPSPPAPIPRVQSVRNE